jgi:endoglucanase
VIRPRNTVDTSGTLLTRADEAEVFVVPSAALSAGQALLQRRMIGAALMAALGTLLPPGIFTTSTRSRAEWAEFRQRFVTAEGRVVDTGNGGVSHSEGQGYGMLLASAYDGREMFDALLGWTLAHLGRPDDRLLAWRHVPGAANPAQSDRNNASDGDLMVAWALLRAGERWREDAYRQRAIAMARDILRLNLVEIDGRLLLRPGVAGFDHGAHVVVNPSYAILPALRDLARLLPDPRWQRLERDMLHLIDEARFGTTGLIADWVEVPRNGGRIRIATEWPGRFSWDAVRVALYLAWAGLHQHPALDAMMRLWFDRELGLPPPAWLDLLSNAQAPYRATPGILAVARLLLARRLNVREIEHVNFPKVAEAADYYNAALIMLSIRAFEELTQGGQNGDDR